MSIEEKINFYKENLDCFEETMDKYKYLLDQGKKSKPFPEEYRKENFKVEGCQSQVWFITELKNKRLIFRATSDAAIVSGLIAILLRIYSDKRPKDIIEAPIHFIEALEFEQHLSPTRSNGLSSMLTAIKNFAIEYE